MKGLWPGPGLLPFLLILVKLTNKAEVKKEVFIDLFIIAPFTRCNSNVIQPQFESNSWLWRHHSLLNCDLEVQTAFEIFGKSHLLPQSSSVFSCARMIFGSCKQTRSTSTIRLSSVGCGRFREEKITISIKKKVETLIGATRIQTQNFYDLQGNHLILGNKYILPEDRLKTRL